MKKITSSIVFLLATSPAFADFGFGNNSFPSWNSMPGFGSNNGTGWNNMPGFGNNNGSAGNNWPGMNFGSTPTPYSGYNMPTWGMPYPTYPAQPLYYYYPVPMQQQPAPAQQAAPVAPSAPTAPVQAATTNTTSVTPAPVAAETIAPSVDTKGVEK